MFDIFQASSVFVREQRESGNDRHKRMMMKNIAMTYIVMRRITVCVQRYKDMVRYVRVVVSKGREWIDPILTKLTNAIKKAIAQGLTGCKQFETGGGCRIEGGAGWKVESVRKVGDNRKGTRSGC